MFSADPLEGSTARPNNEEAHVQTRMVSAGSGQPVWPHQLATVETLTIPAIIPFQVTGAVTATGGGGTRALWRRSPAGARTGASADPRTVPGTLCVLGSLTIQQYKGGEATDGREVY
jgi:hypothetical protein